MRTKNFTEHGQVLVLIALAAVGLFAMVGLAIDGSAKFSDQRHAQNAADTAALAGSLALVNDDSTWQVDAYQRATDNGYSGDLVRNQVWVFKCNADTTDRGGAPKDCGPYEGNANYVTVIIKSRVNTTFARVIGVQQMQNMVQAVTYWNKRGPLYDGNLLVALNPNECSGQNGNVKLGGSSTITLDGGGAFVNSGGNGCGMEQIGSKCPVIIDGSLGSTGDGNINMGSCTGLPAPDYGQDAYQFPPEMPDVPDACGYSPAPYSSDSKTKTTTLYQGSYTSFPPSGTKKNPVYDDIILSPGVYCLKGGLKVTSSPNITGSDVLLYFPAGQEFDISGSVINLSGRSGGDYEGYLIIVDSDFAGKPETCHINGNSGNSYTGTIFAPYCDITVNGNDTTASFDTQIIGYTVTINGNANTHLYYDADNSADSEPKVGLSQ